MYSNPEAKRILVGNKTDLKDTRNVNSSFAEVCVCVCERERERERERGRERDMYVLK